MLYEEYCYHSLQSLLISCICFEDITCSYPLTWITNPLASLSLCDLICMLFQVPPSIIIRLYFFPCRATETCIKMIQNTRVKALILKRFVIDWQHSKRSEGQLHFANFSAMIGMAPSIDVIFGIATRTVLIKYYCTGNLHNQ